MKNKVLKRLRSRAGETILETLIGLLISALALTMLAASIAATSRMVEHSENRMQAYYNVNNALVGRSVSISADYSAMFTNGTANVSVSGSGTTPVRLTTTTGTPISPQCTYYVNQTIPGKLVVAYAIGG